MTERKKGAGGKLKRSEIVTVRFDPRVLFGAELAATRQRRTLSSFIETAVEEQLKAVSAGPVGSIADVVEQVWSTDPVRRFARLAFHYPHLLSHDEQRLFELVSGCAPFWKGQWEGDYWVWHIEPSSLILSAVEDHWELLQRILAGEAEASELPGLPRRRLVRARLMTDEERRQIAQKEQWRTSPSFGGDDDAERG